MSIVSGTLEVKYTRSYFPGTTLGDGCSPGKFFNRSGDEISKESNVNKTKHFIFRANKIRLTKSIIVSTFNLFINDVIINIHIYSAMLA